MPRFPNRFAVVDFVDGATDRKTFPFPEVGGLEKSKISEGNLIYACSRKIVDLVVGGDENSV